jgi:hypothetical protein
MMLVNAKRDRLTMIILVDRRTPAPLAAYLAGHTVTKAKSHPAATLRSRFRIQPTLNGGM